jgi:hypothetical protein
MPYAVLSSLVTDCIHTRGQTSAIQHILQMSGGICSLKTKTENAGLLVKVLSSHEVIRLLDTPSARRNYVELVCQWAKVGYRVFSLLLLTVQHQLIQFDSRSIQSLLLAKI